MDAEQINEWIIFEQRALKSVLLGNVRNDIGIKRLLQIATVPSFQAAISWEICQKGDKNYWAVTTRWQRDQDLLKFQTPVERLKHPRILHPTIETKSLELVSFTVEDFLDKLKQISISAYIEKRNFGTDGTRYELSFGDLFLNARYGWWQEGPIEWKPLVGTVINFLNMLESLYKQ